MVGWDVFGEGALDHLERDAGDAGEGASEEELQAECEGVDGAFGGEEAEVEGGVDFEVLHVKPGGGSGGLGDEESERRAEEGGFYGEDDIRLPEGLAKHDGDAAEHEGCEVRYSLEAGGFFGDVEGATEDDWFAGNFFCAVEFAAVIFVDAPCRVVRRRGDDADLMAARCEPVGQLAGIFADSGEFRGVVEPVDQNFQTSSCQVSLRFHFYLGNGADYFARADRVRTDSSEGGVRQTIAS